jgi:lysophospholipid acyltransferase (LPLAT)-like uncharacterized protein
MPRPHPEAHSLANPRMSVYVRSSVVPLGKAIRRLRFYLLETIVLPLALLPLRALMWTWHAPGPAPGLLAELAALPRVIFTIWHGTLLEGLAFTALWRPYGRRWVVLTTPSLDGRFAAAMLERFGVRCAPLLPGARGAEAAREFVRRVEAGDIGVILVDGPRGPRRVVKQGVARTIAAAGARVVIAGLAASRALQLNSWDRTEIPVPWARVETCCRLLPPPGAGATWDAAAIQAAMDSAHADAQTACVSPVGTRERRHAPSPAAPRTPPGSA